MVTASQMSQVSTQYPTSNDRRLSSFVLKSCIFATGLAGIVAEYIMSTLASYLLGNTVLQWTLTVSLMLFAMGIGSRMSQFIKKDLLDAFIIIEFTLSLLCAISATLVYFLASYTHYIGLLIYSIAISIGILIGLEIPLATRLNNYFEELRVNISSVMEKDYYGALLGGLLFAFVALPYLGLTYTPIILGTINFVVASILFIRFYGTIHNRLFITAGMIIIPIFLILLTIFAKPIVLYGEQYKYKDRIIYQQQTPYQRIVITEWKDNFWLYLNGNEQFSSFDEERYHEPLVHPAVQLAATSQNILILGGGDGLAARELLKYDQIEKITIVDIDPAVTALGRENAIFVQLNKGSLLNSRVSILNQDAYKYLENQRSLFDVIIIDLPDPKSIDLARLYSLQFYSLIKQHLSTGGTVVTQATSPFFSRKAFLNILKTMEATGMPAIAYHNHIPTLGEWGWVLAMKTDRINKQDLIERMKAISLENIETRFLNDAALQGMLSFGKGMFEDYNAIEINDELNLVLFNYYSRGSWDIY
jgi:spermidine synthase